MDALIGFAFTYVLRQPNQDLYIGSTDDLDKRMKEHFAGTGGRTTKIFGADALLYVEACRSLAEARRREKQLKTGYGRGYLKKRLCSELPCPACPPECE